MTRRKQRPSAERKQQARHHFRQRRRCFLLPCDASLLNTS